MSSIDPYSQWLGLQRGPNGHNHYQLLGLRNFENNSHEINASYYKRVVSVSLHRDGIYAKECVALLKELETARNCLVDPSLRADYDQDLRASFRLNAAKSKVHAVNCDAGQRSSLDLPLAENSESPALEIADAVQSPTKVTNLETALVSESPLTQKPDSGTGVAAVAAKSQADGIKSRRTFSGAPFGMLSIRKEPQEFFQDLIESRGLTPYQQKAVDAGRLSDLLVGHYVIEDEFPRGEIGHTFVALKMSTGTLVSLRVLPREIALSEKELRKHAARVSAVVTSGIQQVIQVSCHETGLLIASDLVHGQDLEQLVKRNGPLSQKLVIDCVMKVCRVLSEARRLGYLHEHLRPSKLVMNRSGNLTIRDLAVSSFMRRAFAAEDEGRLQVKSEESFFAYASKEELSLSQRFTEASSIYSLGGICYFLLTGETPQQAEGSFPERNAREDFPPVDFGSKFGMKWQEFVAKAMADSPADRHGSIQEFADELLKLRTVGAQVSTDWQFVKDDVSTHIDAPVPTPATVKWSRAVVWGSTVVTAGVLAALAFLWLQSVGEHERVDLQPVRPSPSVVERVGIGSDAPLNRVKTNPEHARNAGLQKFESANSHITDQTGTTQPSKVIEVQAEAVIEF